MTKPQVIPAVIAKTQEEMEERIAKVREFAELIQLDVMDGVFVPNKSLDFDFRGPAGCRYEAHLMVQNPEEWLKLYWEKADTILIPIESCRDPEWAVDFLKNKKKFGFALNPPTPLANIEKFLGDIGQVLIMTVDPGAYGGEFQPEALEKVKELRKIKPEMDIEVDGGIDVMNIRLAYEAGNNLFVSGSYIMEATDPREAIEELKQKIK